MKYLFSLLIIFTLLSCSKDTTVNIRLKNVSSSTFESTTFKNENYGELAPGQLSEYKQFESSYRYASFSVVADGQTFDWNPIDYVGEDLLKSGDYTFELDVVQNGLSFVLVED